MALLEDPRAIDDLDTARGKDGPRVSGAERRQRRHSGYHATGNAAEPEVVVNRQARDQIVGTERLVGHVVDGGAKFLEAIGVERHASRPLVTAEPEEHGRTAL